MAVEQHPFAPFVPQKAHFLFLGTFPPKPEKWSMDFFYPNKINDMWRIMGTIFYNDRNRFWNEAEKRFEIEPIKSFLEEHRIAMYDTAFKVERLKDNASDKFLNIIERVDLQGLLDACPTISVIVTTGEKAASVVSEISCSTIPKVGTYCNIKIGLHHNVRHYRMPSTSRAYPLALDKKAQFYRQMFQAENAL